jgi:hypothetical protein
MSDECDCEKEAEYEIEIFEQHLRTQIKNLTKQGVDKKTAKMMVIDNDREKGNEMMYR